MNAILIALAVIGAIAVMTAIAGAVAVWVVPPPPRVSADGRTALADPPGTTPFTMPDDAEIDQWMTELERKYGNG